jgi:hypothetical protein
MNAKAAGWLLSGKWTGGSEYWDPATYLLLLSLMQSFLGLTVGSCL